MQYRPEIDGLRAIAVVPVILFHAGYSLFSGGYVGVDVFFVISGYLITGIIISELNTNSFSLVKFYERRARRILPALFFVIVCCLPFSWLWMLPAQFKDFSQTVFAVSIFASNVLFAYKHGYFSENAVDEKPLLHTWSLGVEEQFYMLFPVALMLLWRFGRNGVFYVIVVAAIVSLLVSEWGWRNAPNYNFYLATSRAWELFAGSICAFTQMGGAQKRSNILSVLGLFLIAASVFYFDEATPFPSVYTLVPVLGTCLVVLYGGDRTYASRLLSTRAFVGIGLISYSAYLWHQPLFAFARIKSLYPPEPWLMTVLAGLSFFLAYGSWRFVETPFRRKSKPLAATPKQVLAGSVFVMAGLMAFGLYGHSTNGKEQLWQNAVHPEVATMYRLISDAKGANLHLQQDDGVCKFNVPKLDARIESRILECLEKYGSGIAVLGGSHAIDLFGAIGSASASKFIVGVTQGYCRPHNPAPFCQYGRFREFISNNRHVFKRIIYEQTGRTLLLDNKGKEVSNSTFLVRPRNDAFPKITVNEANLAQVHDYLLDLASFTKVIWLGPRIEPHISERFMLRVGCKFQYTLAPGKTAPFYDLDKAIKNKILGTPKPGLEYVSQIEMVNFDIGSDFTTCANLYWSDGNHWSAHGERLFGQRLKELVNF